MHTIRHILNSKGRDVYALRPDDTVYRAIEIMAEKGVGALVVTENEQLVGIVSERDYARKVILEGRASRETAVRDIMTKDVITGPEGMLNQEAMAIMTKYRIRHLPILDGDRLTGMISMGDCVKARLKEQENLIADLESYITR